MKWIPPIPYGALYSPPALKLGHALALLGWCYDNVTTGGWLDLNLQEVAADLNTPYRTIKLWWQSLRTSEIVAEVQDRGRRGLRVRIADDWIDWRILNARQPEINEPVIGQDIAPQTENEPEMGSKWAVNGARNGPSNSMYKVLHDDHESSPPTSLKPDATNGHKPTPNREMVMMLMAKGVKSSKVANEIAMMGLDVSTVEQSIDNLLADNRTKIEAVIGFLRTNPPEKDKPYPRAAPRASPKNGIPVPTKPLIPPDMLTPQQIAERSRAKRAERDH